MFLLTTLAFVSWLLRGALCAQEFINPPPFGKPKDFRENHIYVTGSIVNIVWNETEPGKKCSLVLYQVNKTNPDLYGDWEMLTRDVVDVTSYDWLVGTRKELAESDVFFLSYFQEGRTEANMNSHYFNIKEREIQEKPSSTSSRPPIKTATVSPNFPSPDVASSTSPTAPSNTAIQSSPPISSSTSSSNSTTTSGSQSSTSASSAQPSSSPSDSPPASPEPPNKITITTIIGVCVGILVALIVLIIAGLLWFRRRAKRRAEAAEAKLAAEQDDGYYRPNLPEAPDRSPKEMGQRGGLWTTRPELPIRSPGELGQNGNLWTGRPELPMKSPSELAQNGNLWTGRPELPAKDMKFEVVRYELP